MKKIAVAGIGAIGSILGACLTRGGEDVTLIEPSWREHAETMKKNGLTYKGQSGEETVKVKVLLIDELSQLKDKIEILFISVKSNDTIKLLNQIKPYLAEDAWIVSLQNGINEDIIIPVVGKENVLVCNSYTGGSVKRPGFVEGHDGYFVIGELDGKTTPRIKELAGILGLVKPVKISDNPILERWNKLLQVTMSVPVSVITGLGLGGVFMDLKAQRLLARVISEVNAVAAAAGYRIESVIGVSMDDWKKLAMGSTLPEISKIISKEGAKFPPNAPDPMTMDIRNGRPLEIDYTNGYVIAKGKELGVPTPVNELVLGKVKAFESGKIKPGIEILDEVLRLTDQQVNP